LFCILCLFLSILFYFLETNPTTGWPIMPTTVKSWSLKLLLSWFCWIKEETQPEYSYAFCDKSTISNTRWHNAT
jgi:hypothetical protein